MRGRGMVMVRGRTEAWGVDGGCGCDDAAMDDNRAQRTTESSVTVNTHSGGNRQTFEVGVLSHCEHDPKAEDDAAKWNRSHHRPNELNLGDGVTRWLSRTM
jgi:hypothetical protein